MVAMRDVENSERLAGLVAIDKRRPRPEKAYALFTVLQSLLNYNVLFLDEWICRFA